jgi:TolB-like protein/DNA-binding winged helix-turn-helix (wHTH) protein
VLPPRPSDALVFGEFEANLRTRELLRNGVRLRLPDQSFQLLTMLMQCPGELVSRADIQKALWPSDTFVDFDHGLNNAMNRLRDVLGDSADSPRFIETLPRRGYRFVANVKKAENGAPSVALPSEALTVQEPPKSRSYRRIWLSVAFTCMVVALAVYFFNVKRSSATPPGPVLHTIAVLPLTNLTTDDSEVEYFVDCMTEALIANLAKAKSLQVASRSSVLRYKGKQKDMRDIARELNVDAVVEGVVVYANHRIRIDVRLIQATTDRHLWAENYDREWTDALELQDEVASDIARKIEARFTSQPQTSTVAPLEKPGTQPLPEPAASE